MNFKPGDRVRVKDGYAMCPTGAVGVVKKFHRADNGSEWVDVEFDPDQAGAPSNGNWFAYRFEKIDQSIWPPPRYLVVIDEHITNSFDDEPQAIEEAARAATELNEDTQVYKLIWKRELKVMAGYV